ncbi:hypothetical protein D9757_005739 [Collybiopsis confluens]|uniref:DUF6598 domain-containing protein n=1 Tax=Collybiopsis confluens TaxID=2823264 RepID=A0A8H5MAX9_9AGAR|nr:hypothetical protein D9757_005739 [Collybiopsis confluens]
MTISYPIGQPLLEVFHVRLSSIDGEDAVGKLYGSITVTDGAGTLDLWNRDESNPLDIKSGEDLLLEGPFRPVYAADEFQIDLELRNHVSQADELFVKGTISFNPFDYYTTYDDIHDHQISGDHGSVTVNYVPIRDALYAQISILPVNGDGGDVAYVYGMITADNGHGQSELFRKANNQHITMEPQQSIPLSRTVVAAPSDGSLVVTANLLSSDNEIAQGSVEFQPEYKKSESKYIAGGHGKVEVQISWL